MITKSKLADTKLFLNEEVRYINKQVHYLIRGGVIEEMVSPKARVVMCKGTTIARISSLLHKFSLSGFGSWSTALSILLLIYTSLMPLFSFFFSFLGFHYKEFFFFFLFPRHVSSEEDEKSRTSILLERIIQQIIKI